MPENFEVHRMEGGRIIVILHPACAISKVAILALLAGLKIDEADVLFLRPEEIVEYFDIDNIPVVIPIDQASCDAPELDVAGRQCGVAGGRVIILFGEAFSYEGLHPIAAKYGTQCGWVVSQLDVCVNGQALALPSSSGGTPITWPKTEQVKC